MKAISFEEEKTKKMKKKQILKELNERKWEEPTDLRELGDKSLEKQTVILEDHKKWDKPVDLRELADKSLEKQTIALQSRYFYVICVVLRNFLC